MEIRVGSCRIIVDFGFPAVLALILLAADRSFLLKVLAVCLLHECGHGIAMWLTGAGLREIRLCGAGMQLRTRTAVLSRFAQNLIYLAGPAVNLLFGVLLWTFQKELAILHLCMGTFNLLPYECLDGGAILGNLAGDRAKLLSIGCVMLSGIFVIFLIWQQIRNPLLYLMLGYLAVNELRKKDF